MIERSKFEWAAQGAKVAPVGLFRVGRGFPLTPGPQLLVGNAGPAALACQRPFSAGIPTPLAVGHQTSLIECTQLAPNRYIGRVEPVVNHSKQKIRVPSTRHSSKGAI